jgi:asparagine synthase (glutamine-hydrolysing)
MNAVLRTDMELVLPGDMLTKVDVMSMANSLEVRVPFLDHRLVDFVSRLPASDKLRGNYRKFMLQDFSRDLLPAHLFDRPKQGFEVPLRGWFLGPMRAFIEANLLDAEKLREQGLFDPPAVHRLWQTIRKGGTGKEEWTLWNLIVLQHQMDHRNIQLPD